MNAVELLGSDVSEAPFGAIGNGCHHCERGIPIDYFKTKAGVLALCLGCVMAWFPNKDVAWWEAQHAPYRDHVQDRIDAVLARQHSENELAMAEEHRRQSAERRRARRRRRSA